MLKFSVALLLIALALDASAKPSYIATRATRVLRHAHVVHNALKISSTSYNKDKPAQQLDNTIDDDDEESKEINILIVELYKEFVLGFFDAKHHSELQKIFGKYPEPDYFNDSSVETYLDNTAADIRVYAKSQGIDISSEE